jgi:deoxyribonuclease-4
MIIFAPGGNTDKFYSEKNKSSLQMPEYLNKIGLNGYEYECTKGIHLSNDSAVTLGKLSRENDINLSIHSQYYISLSSMEIEKREKSVEYLMGCFRIAKLMGAKRIVVHTGSATKQKRTDALKLAIDTLTQTLVQARSEGYDDIFLCPETMGKINQLGDLDEVIKVCNTDEMLIPTIDFGHLNSRTVGGIKGYSDYLEIIEKMEDKLGSDKTKIFHCHFSKIEFTTQGEKKHLTFEDNIFGPDFEPLMEVLHKKNLTPFIVCESAGTQDIDALAMKNYYNSL